MSQFATEKRAIGRLRRGLLTRFLKSSKGGLTVGIAVASPAILAVVGLAVDYSVSQLKVGELQASADAAAIAGANEFALSGSTERSIESVVQAYVAAQNNRGEAQITSVANVNRKKGTVQVVIRENWTPAFAHFLNAKITPIYVSATATLMGKASICVLTLNGSEPKAMHLDNDAKLTANGCGVYSNSTNAEGVRLDANARITSALTCSAGGINAKNGAIEPFPLTDCPPVPDPLASRVAPSVGACDFTKLKVEGGNKTLHPGTYCGGLEITGSSKVTFTPGVYVMNDGEFKVQDNAQITGEYVTFYLTGDASTILFTNNASVRLTGSKEGNMAGLLIFEDRASKLGRQHEIWSPNVEELTGTIYLSRGELLVDPNDKVAASSAYTAIISHKLQLKDGPELILNSNYDATDVPVPDGIRTADQIVLTD